MPTFIVTDPASGREIELTGDTPPTEAELEQIFSTISPQQPTGFTPSPQQNNVGLVEGGAQSLLQGATLGFSDEIQSFIAAAVASPFIEDKTFGQIMQDARRSFRKDQDQFREENPNTALALELAGSLTTGGAGLAKTGVAKAGTTLAGNTARALTTGAATGTAAGAGFADAEDFFSQETLEEAAKTGTLGAVLGGATPAVIKAAVSAGKLIPKALPESLMETAVKIRPSVPQDKRTTMIQTALEEGIMPTTKGLEKISQTLTNLDAGLDDIIDTATRNGTKIPKKALFKELGKLRKDLGGVNLRASKNLKKIDSVVKDFDQQLKSINKARLTPREVQDLKRSAYKQLRFDVSQQSASFAEAEAEKAIIRGARESLEDLGPEVKAINQREGKLLELGEELERAVGRLDNRNLISLDTAAKVAAGSATGSPAGTIIGATSAGLGAPRVKAKTALILENIRRSSELAEKANRTLSPEAAATFAVLVEDNKNALNDLIEE